MEGQRDRKMERWKTERRKDGRTERWKDRRTELFTCLITDQVCWDKWNGSLIQVLLLVQVPWQEARRILHWYFRSRASGQGRGVCRNDGGQSWSRLLQRFHTLILLEHRLAGAEAEHGSEFRLGLQVQA